MKKTAKRILVLLLAFSMFFVLCGCDALDEMRDMQAFLNEDGTITWQGNIYKKLPNSEYLNPEREYVLCVTEQDVPVLLSEVFQKMSLSATKDKKVLVNLYGEDWSYCIESEYEEMCAKIKAPFAPEIVCYNYSYFNEETGMFEGKYYTLTQEQVDAIKLVIETVAPTELSDGMYMDTMYTIFLEECSADMVFRRDVMDISLSASGKTYYISLYTDTEDILFTVPEGCNAIFDDIFKAVIDNAERFADGDLPLI